jgi:cell fate regulator YaaT (PSP1 superfamily)
MRLAMQHFIRVGILGHVGRFAATDAARYPRGARVICRTKRGLELGEVLSVADAFAPATDGMLLRRVTVEDDLLLDRLTRNRNEAFAACSARIAERQLPVVLVDVEHLFDGASLFFYFLGEVTPELDAITGELAALYDAHVQFQKFADVLAHGCGPDCGTEEAAYGDGGCATCGTCHN